MDGSTTIFMTGATSGFGKLACIELVIKGVNVILGYRDEQKAFAIKKEIDQLLTIKKGKLTLIQCNLSSFESVKAACDSIRNDFDSLDQLILNAGLWNAQFQETENDIEETLQVNYLSNVLIINELSPLLSNVSKSKIIITASALHQGKINFNDLEFKKKFSGFRAYRQSKLAVIQLTQLLSQKLSPKGIAIYCFHPGVIRTELARSSGFFMKMFFRLMGKRTEKGAETLLYLSLTDKNLLTSGAYYSDKTMKTASAESNNIETGQQLLTIAWDYTSHFITPAIIFTDEK